MKQESIKKEYLPPVLEIIDLAVEKGFATSDVKSPTAIGNNPETYEEVVW